VLVKEASAGSGPPGAQLHAPGGKGIQDPFDRAPDRRSAPFGPRIEHHCRDGVPTASVIPVCGRHPAAIPIEAGRFSQGFMRLRPNGTSF
jgi:hypothetical protein